MSEILQWANATDTQQLQIIALATERRALRQQRMAGR